MTANSTEAETDKAIPLDKLSSRSGGKTGREGYVVFVLNIGRMLNIYNIAANVEMPSLASQLPQGHVSNDSLCFNTKHGGSWLASDAFRPDEVYGQTQNGSHH
ncbi:hypothetical protein [Pseudomonas sp. McL0111]|uniref:hypothetical protein n=1 Tax=Pseudomonas sp. McL0111 TaxID=3457357 RepID=UPI00403EA0F5